MPTTASVGSSVGAGLGDLWSFFFGNGTAENPNGGILIGVAIRGRRKRAQVVQRAQVVMVACWVMAAMGLTGATAGRQVGSATEVMVVQAWRARRWFRRQWWDRWVVHR